MNQAERDIGEGRMPLLKSDSKISEPGLNSKDRMTLESGEPLAFN